jgi:hypothetical protein
MGSSLVISCPIIFPAFFCCSIRRCSDAKPWLLNTQVIFKTQDSDISSVMGYRGFQLICRGDAEGRVHSARDRRMDAIVGKQ